MPNDIQNQDNHLKQLQEQLNTARSEINNLRQQLRKLNHVHRKEYDKIHNQLESWRCAGCQNIDGAGACALPENETGMATKKQIGGAAVVASSVIPENQTIARYIGVIRTHFPEKRGTPRQPGICPGAIAKLVLNDDVFTNPQHALEGIEEFSHMW